MQVIAFFSAHATKTLGFLQVTLGAIAGATEVIPAGATEILRDGLRDTHGMAWLLQLKGAGMKYLALLLLLPVSAFAQVTTTRVTAYDWQCQDAAGVKISDHTRFDTAFVACLNAPNGSLVKGGTYRINKPSAPLTGNASLTWPLPTLSVDGTPIKPITGFDIEYSRDPANFVQAVVVPLSTAYTVPGLATGTWYFRMRTITATDGKSAWTNLLSLII
jgi:hypothetical protein